MKKLPTWGQFVVVFVAAGVLGGISQLFNLPSMFVTIGCIGITILVLVNGKN